LISLIGINQLNLNNWSDLWVVVVVAVAKVMMKKKEQEQAQEKTTEQTEAAEK
jgi:hypothetical protein